MLAFGFKGPHPAQAPQFEALLPHLVEAGFSWVEVLAPEEADRTWEARLRGWQQAYGLHVSVHARFFGVNLASPNPHVRQAALTVAAEDIAFAARVGARRINFHAGDVNWYDVPPPSHPEHDRLNQGLRRLRQQFLGTAHDSLGHVARQAREAGLKPLVENLYRPWELLRSPEEARAFLSDLPEYLGFTLDTGHALLAGHAPDEFLRALEGRVCHLHVHTNDRYYDVHAFPNLEDAAIEGVVRALPQHTPEAVLLIEIIPGSDHGPLESFRAWPQAVRQAMNGVMQVM